MMTAIDSIPWMKIIVIIIAVIVILLIIAVVIISSKLNEEIDKRRDLRRKVDSLADKIYQQIPTPSHKPVVKSSTIAQNSTPKISQNTSQPIEEQMVADTIQEPVTPPVVYVKHHNRGIFAECDVSTAQYRLFDIKADNAQFEFCGDVEKSIKNSDATFDFVAELQGEMENAKNIITVKAGVAIRQDGRWKVINKAVLKFE